MLFCLMILAACSTSVGYVSDTNIVKLLGFLVKLVCNVFEILSQKKKSNFSTFYFHVVYILMLDET